MKSLAFWIVFVFLILLVGALSYWLTSDSPLFSPGFRSFATGEKLAGPDPDKECFYGGSTGFDLTPSQRKGCKMKCEGMFPDDSEERAKCLNDIESQKELLPLTCSLGVKCIVGTGIEPPYDESDIDDLYPPSECVVGKNRQGKYEARVKCNSDYCEATLLAGCVCYTKSRD